MKKNNGVLNLKKLANYRMGKNYEQIYGKERTIKIKEKISIGNKGKKVSEESKKRMSLSAKGRKRTEEWKKLMSKRMEGDKNPMYGKKGILSPFYGKHHTKENRQKFRLAMIGDKNPMYGKHLSQKNIEMLRKINTGKKRSEETKKLIGIRNRAFMLIKWKDKNFRVKILSETNRMKRLKGLMKRPTSYEQRVSELCFKFNLPFVYKGSGGFLINFKNPDFVNEKDRIVIEVFHSYFKIKDYGSVENYKDYCKLKYEPADWKVIFLDENDVMNENWEEKCLNKIKEYTKERWTKKWN